MMSTRVALLGCPTGRAGYMLALGGAWCEDTCSSLVWGKAGGASLNGLGGGQGGGGTDVNREGFDWVGTTQNVRVPGAGGGGRISTVRVSIGLGRPKTSVFRGRGGGRSSSVGV